MIKLEGKIAVIIIANIGIGETTSHLFAEHGAQHLRADVKITDLGNTFEFIHCNVRNDEHVATTMDKGSGFLPPQPRPFICVGVNQYPWIWEKIVGVFTSL